MICDLLYQTNCCHILLIMGFAHILNTQWKDTREKIYLFITFYHLSSQPTYMHVKGGAPLLVRCSVASHQKQMAKNQQPREQQLELTQTADQMGSGQRYQDINPNFPVPWLPNTRQCSGMYHLFYILQTIVVSNPALASFEPELKQYPIKTNYLLLKDSNNEQDTLLKKH